MTMDHFSEYKAIQNEINAALETYFTADLSLIHISEPTRPY